MAAEDRYAELADDLVARNPDVELTKMMGMPAIKAGGKLIGGQAGKCHIYIVIHRCGGGLLYQRRGVQTIRAHKLGAGIEQQRPSSTENEIRVISLVVTWLTERVRVRVDVCTAQ